MANKFYVLRENTEEGKILNIHTKKGMAYKEQQYLLLKNNSVIVEEVDNIVIN